MQIPFMRKAVFAEPVLTACFLGAPSAQADSCGSVYSGFRLTGTGGTSRHAALVFVRASIFLSPPWRSSPAPIPVRLRMLYAFQRGTDGHYPIGKLTPEGQALCSATYVGGGERDCGTVYRVKGDGTEKVIHAFAGGSTVGAFPGGVLPSRPVWHNNMWRWYRLQREWMWDHLPHQAMSTRRP